MTPDWQTDDGSVRLFLGDCRDILPSIQADAIVTDPPYGIGIANNPVRQSHERKAWDDSRPTDAEIRSLIGMSREQIIWGGNYFDLPPSQCFLVWDKCQPFDFSLAMCELAWCSIKGPAKLFRKAVTSYAKQHPTQKPVELMDWCLGMLPAEYTVVDPYMGSGTTIVSAIRLGRNAVGMERDADYFRETVDRIESELSRQPLFKEPSARQLEVFA